MRKVTRIQSLPPPQRSNGRAPRLMTRAEATSPKGIVWRPVTKNSSLYGLHKNAGITPPTM